MTTDSRFFAGYTWVSESADCRVGLCMPTVVPVDAVRLYFAGDAKYHHNKGKSRTAYTMATPNEAPTQHTITL